MLAGSRVLQQLLKEGRVDQAVIKEQLNFLGHVGPGCRRPASTTEHGNLIAPNKKRCMSDFQLNLQGNQAPPTHKPGIKRKWVDEVFDGRILSKG